MTDGATRGSVTLLGTAVGRPPAAAEVLADLHLDRLFDAVVHGQEEPEWLRDLYTRPLRDLDGVRYRQEVFRDLEAVPVLETLERAVTDLQQVRRRLAQLGERHSSYARQGRFLDAAARYCAAVRELKDRMDRLGGTLQSRGLVSVRDFLHGYVDGPAFRALADEAAGAKEQLGRVAYNVRVRGLRVEVSRYNGEADYSDEVGEVFARFRQAEAQHFLVEYRGWPALGYVGERILELVARLFPDEFAALNAFCRHHPDFFDPVVRQVERELRFYLAYLAHIAPLRRAGLPLCLPAVSDTSKAEVATAVFDLALADKLVHELRPVVGNDYLLDGEERIFVVSGPNQGGKTTFARTFGQLHHLAAIGCPVPGAQCRLFLCDQIFTHFRQAEHTEALVGKLEDDLQHAGAIFAAATETSVIVMNEPFSSTTLTDARFLGRKALTKLTDLDVLGVYVTFVDELSRLGPAIVSVVSTVDPDDPATRTYKVVRAPADGLAYALSLARRRRVTYEQLRERLAS